MNSDRAKLITLQKKFVQLESDKIQNEFALRQELRAANEKANIYKKEFHIYQNAYYNTIDFKVINWFNKLMKKQRSRYAEIRDRFRCLFRGCDH